MKPGIYESMPEHVYRKAPGISQSSLKAIARSPAHFKAGVEEEREDTDALLLGRLVSTLVLEPDRSPWWVIKPDKIAFNEKEGKDWAKEVLNWDESVDGKFPRKVDDAFSMKGITYVTSKMFQQASRMATVLMDSKKPEVRDIFANSKREVSVFANAETEHGEVLCKCRPDIVPVGANVLCDLKTTMDCRPESFTRTVLKWKYQIQAHSYLQHWNAVCDPNDRREIFLLVGIEKCPPFAHTVFRMDEDFIMDGANQYQSLLNTYALCVKNNEWPDYPDGIQTLSLPNRLQTTIE